MAASQSLNATQFANTLTFTANATLSSALNAGVFGGMGPGGLVTLSLSNASSLLVRSGVTANINVGALQSTTPGTTPYVHVVGTGVLNVNAAYALGGTAGLMKAGSGVMNLNRQAYFTGTTTVNGGTLNLLSGAANTLAVVPTQTATLGALSLNGLDALVDLRNRAQAVGVLNSINDQPGQGGTVTNSGASIVPFTVSTAAANSTFAGSITGNISLVRSGGNTLTLTDASSYAGETIVRGGTLRLKDAGAITGTAGLKLYYGQLNWDNFGYNPVLNPVRLSAANPVFLRGGAFTVNGAGSTDTALTLNSVTVESGANVINTLPYVNMGSTVSLTVGNLVRGANTRSGVNFNGWTTNNHTGTNSLGNQSLAASARVFLTRVNGALFSESSLNDGLIGGWAVADGSTFATYSNTFGVVAMGNTFGGFTSRAFDGDLSGTLSNTRNISDTADRNLSGAVALNSLRYAAGTTARTITFATGATLALDVGFISNSGSNVTLAAADATNTFSGTGADLFLYNNQGNSIIIEPRVTGAANLIINGPTTVSLRPKFGNNDYAGATFVNAGTLNLQGTAGRTFSGSVARGVFAGATIAPTSAVVTMTSTAGLAPGMTLNNANFLAGTTVLSVDSATQVTLSNPSTNATEVTAASFVAPASAAVTLTTTSGLVPGLVFNNANFPVGTTVLSVDSATQVTLSNPSTATAAQASQTLTAAGLSFVAVPGNLNIENAAVTMGATPGQIAAESNITIRGAGSLTFANYAALTTQNLQSLTFINEGGAGTPTFSLGTPTVAAATVVLTSASPITSTNDSFSFTPLVTGSGNFAFLQFSAANPVITVNQGLAPTGLSIAAAISQHSSMTSLTKAGNGVLDMRGASTFTSGFNLQAGGLMFGANSTPTSGTVTSGPVGRGTLAIAGGTFLLSDGTARTIANAVTVGGDFSFGGLVAGNSLILSGAADLGAASRTVTVTSPAVTGTLSGPLASTATGTALTKAGPGVLVLSSTTSNLGGAGITVAAGMLRLGATGAIPVSSPLTINAGAGFDLGGFNFDLTTQTVVSSGFITNSASSTSTIHVLGTSVTDVTSTTDASIGLTLVDNFLANTASRLGLTKAGLGTLTFTNTTSLNSGNVLVVAGRVTGSADNTFSPNAAVVLGNATTGALTATLEAGAFNQTIGGLVASNPNASGLASIVVGAGKTLTVNGAVTLGANAAASATNVTFSGGGAMVVNSGGANFQVGGATGDTNGNAANVNLTGLASFTANLGAGTLRVGDGASSTAVPASVLRLAPISTITAATIRVGDASGGDFNHTLFLGSGVNTFRTDTLNIGSAGAGIRSSGTIQFDAADVTGSLSLRGSNGVSPATVNLLNSTGTTGVSMAATADFAGHAADLLIGTMTMAARNNATAAATATFSFDQGVLDITTLTAASRTSTGSGNATATLNLGGGVVDIDSVAMAINTSAGGTVTSTINITGGAVSLGAGTGTAVNMANAGTGRTVTSAINMSGGTLSLAGNIVRTGGAGTENATVTLSGGILDMNGFAFGEATRTISLTAQAGTLRDVGTLNGTGGLTKSGAGILTLDGTAAYTGVTTVSGGTLVMANSSSAATGITLSSGTNTTVQVTSVASAGTGQFIVATAAVTPAIRFTVDGGGTIAFPHSFAGNSGPVTTIHVDNNGSGTNGVVQLNGNGGAGWGNATLNVTGGNGYSLYIANLFNFAGGLGAMTFNPTTAALELGNLTVGRNTGTGTFILSGTNTESRVSGVISNGSGANLGGLSAVTKSGTGTWTLTGANTYTGATTISAGTLNAAAGSLAATASIAVNGAILSAVNYNAAATLALNATGTATISGSDLTITGAITNANTAANALNFTAATGKITLASLAGAGATRFGSDADVTGGISAGTVTVVGALGASISGGTVSAASLTAGSITGGSNTITGAATVTTVNGGTTSIGGIATITTLTSGTVNLTAATGTVTNVDGGTITLAGTTLTATNGNGSAALTLDAASSATFSGAGVSLGAVTNVNTAEDSLLFSAASGTATLTSLGGAGKSRFASNASIGTLSGGTVTIDGSTASITNLNGGSISLGSTALTVNSGTFGGVISGANGSLTKSGAGTLILIGANTFGGGTTISAGTLQLGNGGTSGSVAAGDVANSGTFAISRSDDLTFASKITGTGGFTQLGAGNLTLAGANDFTGATLVSAGTLTAASGALSATSGITVNGALFAAADYNLAATLALDASATATISAADLNISGAVTNAGTAAAALNFTASTGKIILASLAGAGRTRFGSDADITAGVSEGNITVVGALGANISGGTVTAGSITGNVSAGTVSAGTLLGDVTGGAVTLTGLLTGNVTAGTVTAGSMTGDVASSVTISGALNGAITAGTNSIGSLTSASVTGGTNTITGAATVTTVNGGTTTVGGVATVTTLTTGTLTFNGASGSIGTLTDGTFNLNGAAATVGTLTAGTITLAASTALTVNDGTFAGSLAGSGSLIKATSGILTLNGANTFTGGTTINAGQITIVDVGSLGSGPVSVAVGATLNLGGLGITNVITRQTDGTNFGAVTGGVSITSVSPSAPATVNTVLTGTEDLTRTGGELTLTTANFYTGSTSVAGETAVIKAAFLDDASSSLGVSTLTDPANLVLGSGATLEFTGSTNAVTTRSFTIGGSATIAASGTGSLEFTTASNFATTGAEPALSLSAGAGLVNRFAASLADGSNPLANLAVDGAGTWILGGAANRFKNDVRIDAGAGATIGLESGALPSGATLAVGNNATLRWEANNSTPVNLEVAAGSTAKLDLGANTVVFTTAPVVTGTGSTTLEKQGSGTLQIANGVSAPTVNVTLPANSGLLSVNGTIGNVTLASGSRLGGTGTVGAANVGTGAILAPGNSPGTLNGDTLVLNGGSVFEWEVQNATSSTGYDKINLTGNLDLTGANPGSKVSFKIISRLGAGDGNTVGDPLNFGPPNGTSSIRTFNFGVVGGVLLNSGQNISDVFEFDLTQFTYSDGSASSAGLWSIAWDGGSAITLTAVPEPSTYGFGLGALALAAAAIRRRRRQAKA